MRWFALHRHRTEFYSKEHHTRFWIIHTRRRAFSFKNFIHTNNIIFFQTTFVNFSCSSRKIRVLCRSYKQQISLYELKSNVRKFGCKKMSFSSRTIALNVPLTVKNTKQKHHHHHHPQHHHFCTFNKVNFPACGKHTKEKVLFWATHTDMKGMCVCVCVRRSWHWRWSLAPELFVQQKKWSDANSK